MKKVTLLFSLITLIGSAALGAVDPVTGLSTEVEKKKWSVSANMEHYLALRADQEPSTDFLGIGSYTLTDSFKVSVLQPVTKVYDAIEGYQEFRAADTLAMGYYTIPGENYFFDKIQLTGGFTLPISDSSRRKELISVPRAGLSFTKSFFSNLISVTYRPSFKYYLNTWNAGTRGTVYRQYSIGSSIRTSINVTDKLSVSYWYTDSWNGFEANNNGVTPPVDASYSVIGWVSYQATDMIGASVGLSQSNSFWQSGRFEGIEVFDAKLTRVYTSLSASY